MLTCWPSCSFCCRSKSDPCSLPDLFLPFAVLCDQKYCQRKHTIVLTSQSVAGCHKEVQGDQCRPVEYCWENCCYSPISCCTEVMCGLMCETAALIPFNLSLFLSKKKKCYAHQLCMKFEKVQCVSTIDMPTE